MVSTVVGPAALHLDLTSAHWATDGLLTIFFFVVGLELKREIVAGELRRPSSAALPIVAAIGGMAVPALVYLRSRRAAAGTCAGWAVPTATDIAFAVAVLAVVGRSLPNALRAFLLTLAVVDDLLAIIVIAVVYSESISFAWLGRIAGRRPRCSACSHAADHHGVAPGAARAAGLGAHARVGRARDDRRRGARPRRPAARRTTARSTASPRTSSTAGARSPPGSPCRCSRSSPPASRWTPRRSPDAARDPAAQGVVVGLVLGKPLGILGRDLAGRRG